MAQQFQPYYTNTASRDRIFKLKAKEGEKVKDPSGITNRGLFTGEVNLHAVQQGNGLWTLYMQNGTLPPSLTGSQWTNFNLCHRAVAEYYNKRNIEIVDIVENA